MNTYQRTLAEMAPDRDPVHMETLAIMLGSTLSDMPLEYFKEIADFAQTMTPERLAAVHRAETFY